ncbi:MAG: Stk1 family PASTA domain-containing Ser/Thr kinase [Ruminococcus flavefaciens]|nr:Stk1 family PASTA domain-containing Ser/Thr kinase [Ruminococcus flavefaciens]MCM1229025.1 Stk1 family PASTA domain-containing Ser/Thr kinase [Ruminococcus flavefaciens]
MDKYIGKKLDGRYEITELIGVGGMAEVYKGVDVIDNKSVAIKILKKEYAENEEFLRRFRNESKAIAVLSHPNIVKIYDVGFSEKLQYIVMEYIEGITLKEYIEEEKVLTWKDTIHFVIQILRALQHAHDKGIVHRDIKPQNIMMFSDGTIKVMDFGIAKFAREEGKTATDQAIGSVHYISPEQASGSVTDQKSDIYSVGAMMYEMLTGQKPFDSDNPVAIAVMHMHDIPERPRALNPDIPDGLEEIVLKAMEKDPLDRYQNTDEMLADIARFKENPNIVFGYYQEESVDDDAETQYVGGYNYADDSVQENVYASVNGDGRYSAQSQAYGNVYDNDEYYDDDDYDEDEDDDDEEEERSSLAVPVLTAVVVVVIIVGVIVISMLLSGMIKDTKTSQNDWRMPDVVGMDFNDAVSSYGNNIKFVEDGEEYNEAEAGIIIEQDIDAGVEFKKGDTLKVKVSKGMETVEVPDLSNKNGELAKDMLKQIGLVGEIKTSSSTEIEEGYVIKTEPEAGQQAHKGSTVIIYVSMGKDLSQVKVDDWVGMTIEDASMLAAYKGLHVKSEDVASYEDEGKVVKQSIEPGEKVDVETEITLYFSNGKKPDGEIPFQIDFPIEANGRFVIAFMFSNEDGTMNIQETSTFYCPEYSSYTQNVVGSGESVSVTISLTNLSNQKRATIGTYEFNFAEGTAVCTAGGDITSAFQQVDGFPQNDDPDEPEESTTTAPDAHQPGVNGDYDAYGNWVDYKAGTNGDYRGGVWSWYTTGTNGEWRNGSWVWYDEVQYSQGDFHNGVWEWYNSGVNGDWGADGFWYWYNGSIGGQW